MNKVVEIRIKDYRELIFRDEVIYTAIFYDPEGNKKKLDIMCSEFHNNLMTYDEFKEYVTNFKE